MKKLISVALTLLLVLQLGAQPKEVQNLLKTYEKTKAQTELARRNDRTATWIRYTQALTKAYSYPTVNF